MTDENWTDEHEPSLADLLGFDLTDEREDDVPAAVGDRLAPLFTEAIGDEPEENVSPLAVIAAARKELDTAAPGNRERAPAAEVMRRRRRSAVVKGVLIAAAAAIVVVAVPTLFRGGSSTDSASTSAASATTAAAGEMNSAAGSDSAGGGQAPAGASEAASSAADAATAALTESASTSGGLQAPAAPQPGRQPTSRAQAQADSSGSESGGGTNAESAPSSTVASGSGAAAGTSCVWPRLDADAVAAALQALEVSKSTPVRQPVRAVCASDRVGAVSIPSAGVTVLVARDDGLTSDPRYGYTTEAATSTGDGISVLVVSSATSDDDRAELTAAQRLEVARAVLDAVR